MRLHTNLNTADVHHALMMAKVAGHVTGDVHFIVDVPHKSNTHPHAYEIQLGTYNKHSLPDGTVDQDGKRMHVRRFKNSGQHGADSVWSATYFEWGWFMMEIFRRDPSARWGGLGKNSFGYRNEQDFHEKTHNRFL